MYGTFGQITTRGDGRIQCHECGRWYARLGRHITSSHEMTVREYQIAYGLPVTRGLVSEQLREDMADRLRQRMASPEGERLRQGIADHAGAAASRDPALLRRAPTLRDEQFGARVSATLTNRNPPLRCEVCGRGFRPVRRRRTCSDECRRVLLARTAPRGSRDPARDAEMLRLHQDEGLSYRQIGDRYGITPEAVGQKVRRARAQV